MSASHGKASGSGKTVRVRRIEAGLTQEQLAELSGLSVRAISDIERGTTAQPRRSSMALIEAVLGPADPGLNAPGDEQPGSQRDGRLAAIPRQLPQAVRGFVGRAHELKALTELLGSREGVPGTVVISAIAGTAGVGKTALAVHWAHQIAEGFPDGQLFVNLRGYDPDQPMPAAHALAGFLRALGVPGRELPAEEDERAALYRSLLAGRQVLVVLDNAGSVGQVRPLLPGAPACTVVVTSRDALAGLVARDGAARLDLDLLPPDDAVGLLRALIGRRVDADPGAAAVLAARCCRLPLALRVAAELAASRPSVPLSELAAELADQQRRLDLLDAGGDPRTGVRVVFSWSYQHLDAETARAFRLLGLHPGPDLDPYAAAALTGSSLEQAYRVLDLLVRAHLIQPAGPGRFGLHDLLRGYALELTTVLDAEEERRAALTRLFDHYLHTAATAMDALYPGERHRRPAVPAPASPEPALTEPASVRAWLDTERACLVAAAAYAAGQGWPGHAIRLAATVFRHLEVAGHYPEIAAIQGHARDAARLTGDRVAEAEALQDLAIVDLLKGRYEQAEDQLRQVLELLGEAGSHSGKARVLGNLGIICFHQGQYRQAARHHEQALTLFRQAGDRFGEARALNNLGFANLLLGRYQQSAGFLRSAEALSRQTGDQAITAYSLINLGLIDLREGRCQQAVTHLEKALALSRETGNRTGHAHSLVNLGIADLRQGRHEQAAGQLRRALALSRELGDRTLETEALNGLGDVFLATGRAARARSWHRAALSLATQIGARYDQACAHSGLARGYYATGATGRARRHWENALALYTSLGVPEADEVRTQLAVV
jgi:tetratricopeptide (TPR) repeat protein/transcriptional regulator with XRE-family HTH domain